MPEGTGISDCRISYAVEWPEARPRARTNAHVARELQYATEWFAFVAEPPHAAGVRHVTFFDGRGTATLSSVALAAEVVFRRWDEMFFLPVLLETLLAFVDVTAVSEGSVPPTTALAFEAAFTLSRDQADRLQERHALDGADSFARVSYSLSQCVLSATPIEGIATLSTCDARSQTFRVRIASVFRTPITSRDALDLSEARVTQCCQWLGLPPLRW